MDFYLFLVIILIGLAVTDLVVGVSNDAVNFLNSAIGSKVAPRHIIMIVASLGIFIGATFSAGIMEVARKGIFNPQFFYFDELMVVFAAVMLTDIILLDTFNTFGLPTSTTVSIVFELLGATVAVSLIKLFENQEAVGVLGDYINGSTAVAIILAIFLSVAIAFTVGSLVMYVSRLLFSFQYQKRLKVVGVVWCALALSGITYFLVFKGAKGASFLTDATINWIEANLSMLLLGAFVFYTALMAILYHIFRVNILKIVVLVGTFGLAMAFAGNDLVNFIGVPIAGLQSYQNWTASGVPAEAFEMAFLADKVTTPSYLLLGAGLVMVLTLWFSKKARTVTETEVNLGRQDEGTERFEPNGLARGIVYAFYNLGKFVRALLPNAWLRSAEKNFKAPAISGPDAPAFDLVRASVNLFTAASLIALATSFKLPLSTTYVSFMVAMGTSLADRAWGRNSAVYRVSGVLSVIGGWFLTAAGAFTAAAIFATIIYYTDWFGVIGLLALAIFLITRSFFYHKNAEAQKARRAASELNLKDASLQEARTQTAESVAETLRSLSGLYGEVMESLVTEDRRKLRNLRKRLTVLKDFNEDFRLRLIRMMRRADEKHAASSRLYLTVYDLQQDLLQSAESVTRSAANHVANLHEPLTPEQGAQVRDIASRVSDYLERTSVALRHQNNAMAVELGAEKKALLAQLETTLIDQVRGIKEEAYKGRDSHLVFSILTETKDIIAVAHRFAKLYNRLEDGNGLTGTFGGYELKLDERDSL